MKALGRIFGELVAWRWAPAVGLCVASLLYVLVVVALVPDEIGVPVTNARFVKKVAPTPAEVSETPTFPTAVPESEVPPPAPAPVRQVGVVDFGRRGFSPPLERPEAPPTPVVPPPPIAPPAPPPVAVAPAMPAPPPPEATEAPVVAEAADASAPMAQQPPPASGIMRALRAVIPGRQIPGGNVPAGPPGAPPGTPPGAEPPATPEAPPAPPAEK
jgi:hypothetical protein